MKRNKFGGKASPSKSKKLPQQYKTTKTPSYGDVIIVNLGENNYVGIFCKSNKAVKWKIIYDDGSITEYGTKQEFKNNTNLQKDFDWKFYEPRTKIHQNLIESFLNNNKVDIIDRIIWLYENIFIANDIRVSEAGQMVYEAAINQKEFKSTLSPTCGGQIPYTPGSNPQVLSIDLNDVFNKTPFGMIANKKSQVEKLKDQLRFYILYTQTFVLDIIHDFGINNNDFGMSWINFYKNHIKDVLNSVLNANITTDLGLYDYIRDNLFDHNIQAHTYIVQHMSSVYPDNYIVSQIFIADEPSIKYLNENGFLQEVMYCILNILGMPLKSITPLFINNKFLPLMVSNNGISKNVTVRKEIDPTIAVSIDVPPSISKPRYLIQYIQKYIDLGCPNSHLIHTTSIADTYDAASSGAEILSLATKYNNEGNLHIYEFFTFSNGIRSNVLEYSINNTTNNSIPQIIINTFFNGIINFTYTNSPSIPAVLVNWAISIDPLKDIKYGLCKLLGDKAKRDYLYCIETGKLTVPSKIINITIFLANDILSSMIACIFLKGSIVTGSTIGHTVKIRERNPIGNSSEFLSIRNDSQLSVIHTKYLNKYKNPNQMSERSLISLGYIEGGPVELGEESGSGSYNRLDEENCSGLFGSAYDACRRFSTGAYRRISGLFNNIPTFMDSSEFGKINNKEIKYLRSLIKNYK